MAVGTGLAPEVEVEVGVEVGVGVGRLELEEPGDMEDIMIGFPPPFAVGVDVGFCTPPGGLATQ